MFRPLVIPALFCVTSAHADPVDFDRDVLPFLKDNCIACHNKTTTKGGLNMETPELMAEGGDSDAGLIPGKGTESIIYQAAAHTWDSEMPPKGNKVDAVNLTTRQLAMLKDWIDQGARPSPKRDKVIAWEPLPAGVQPIYALAASPQGGFVAAARANQISLYHLPTQSLVTRLTDESLLKSGLYKQPGVAHRDLVQALAFSPDGARLATGSFREVKIWKLSLPAPAPGASAKFTATQEPDNSIKLNEGAKLVAHIKSEFAAEQALAQHTLATARAALEVSYQNEAIKKAETAATDQTNRLKKANELAELAKKSLEDKKKDLKTKQDARATADKAAKDVDAEVAKATTGKPDDALAKKLAEAQANAAKAAAEFSQAQAALKKAETSVAAAEAKKTPELAELIALAKVGVGEQMKALKPKEEAKSAADKATKEIAAQVAALPKMKADDALLKKQTEAKEKAAKATADLKVAEEALTRGEAAVTDAANEIKLVTENEKLAKQAVADEKARLEIVKKTSEKAAAERDLAAKALENGMKKAQALQFSANGLELVATFESGPPQAWSTVNGKPILPGSTGAVWGLERVLGSGDASSPITDRANSLAFSPDGKTLAVGSGEPSRSGDITLWDMATGKVVKNYADHHIDSVLALDFTPDGKLLASGGADKAVRVTDLSTGKVAKVFEGHTHHVLGLTWRADGRMLASSGADNVVKVWDWTTGDRRKSIDGWDKEVTGISYLGAADQFATGAGDNKLRLLTSDGGEVKKLDGAASFLQSLATTRGGEVVLGGDQDGVLKAWDVPTAKVIAEFKP